MLNKLFRFSVVFSFITTSIWAQINNSPTIRVDPSGKIIRDSVIINANPYPVSEPIKAQESKDRFDFLEDKLKELSKKDIPGLKQPVDFSVSGLSIQEFLRAIAEANSLNINIDPSLNFKLVNNFTNEKVMNVIVFLCREYDLNIRFTGNIMSFYKQPDAPKPTTINTPKDINVAYSSYNDRLSMDLKNDSLDKVIKKIIQISKKNVVLAPGLSNKPMSVYLENMPFENAIERLAFANGLKMEKGKDNVITLEPLEVFSPETNNNNSSGFNSNNNSSGNSRKNRNNKSSDEVQFEIVTDVMGRKLINLNIVNQSISDIIKQIAKELGLNYFIFSEPKGNATTKVSSASFEELVRLLLQGTDHTIKNEDNVYLIGERATEGFRATKVVQLQYRSGEIIIDNIPGELKKGVDIKYFKELNSLILSGSAPQILEISAFIREIDKLVPVIQLEVILVNIDKSRTIKTGLKAGFNDTLKTGGGTILPGIDYTFNSKIINDLINGISGNNVINLGKVNASFYVSLNALEQLDNADIQQTPKLSTLNGHEATLKIGQTRYYEISTQNVTGSLTTNTIRTVQYQSAQANLSIKVTPIVSGDDQVTMDIDFENSGFINFPAAGPPPTQTSAFKSLIRVKNEEMIVLGGLESEGKSESGTGIPVLSRIPILKWIFSSKTKSKTRRKQLIFIRPTITY